MTDEDLIGDSVNDSVPKTVSVGITKTINTGNFESLKISVGLSEGVNPAADTQKEIDRIWEECRKALNKRVKAVKRNVE